MSHFRWKNSEIRELILQEDIKLASKVLKKDRSKVVDYKMKWRNYKGNKLTLAGFEETERAVTPYLIKYLIVVFYT